MQVHGDLHDAGGSLDPKITGLQEKPKRRQGVFFSPIFVPRSTRLLEAHDDLCLGMFMLFKPV